jgi:N-acetylglucosaminyl-diphospho-decaprenol L-rhamnosyltransferase
MTDAATAAEGPEHAGSEVAVVVVSHETREEAVACLRSADAAGASELVLVDNGSTDGTAAAARAAVPRTRILELANAGFARGANAGVRATRAPVVVVANADVRFAPDALQVLAGCLLEEPDVAAVGPLVTYPDGSPQASARRVPDVATAVGHAVLGRVMPGNRFTRHYRALDADPSRRRDVDWLSGCAVALRRSAFDEVGGFDPGYFLYVEDVDLGVRLRAASWRLRYEPAARVDHRVGASTHRRRGRALLHHARGLDRFYGRHLATTVPRRVARGLLRVALVGWVAASLLGERLERLLGLRRSTTGERGGRV